MVEIRVLSAHDRALLPEKKGIFPLVDGFLSTNLYLCFQEHSLGYSTAVVNNCL